MKKSACLIVGFGSGVSLGIAKAFGGLGFQLALLSRNPQKNSAPLAELVRLGVTAKAFVADAGDEDSLALAIDKATVETGEIEVLIYNAVAPTFVPPKQLMAQKLVEDFRVNLAGAPAATLPVLPAMRDKSKGTILFTGGGWALQPGRAAAPPSIGKAGLRSLAQELVGSGIHVGTVTIAGEVKAGTHLDPDKIAEAFVKLHQQLPKEFGTEITYQ